MTRGPWRDRHDPTSPKANPHWAAMFLAKRRALDRIILAEAESLIAAEEASPQPSVSLAEPLLDQDAKTPEWSKLQRPITAAEMLAHPEALAEAMTGDVNRIKRPDQSERARISRAFGRPLR